ncbi:helix-turn-helix domain-containing protein [Nocardia cerradoensis]|uniref:helix-turn-helix domain-containing protein n=2 Tax=Nocardia cerradoensis TaxID=85688 RepID=UPI0002D9F127|nr:AraC family transcriptional regulator [Nocardia cerradoensis]
MEDRAAGWEIVRPRRLADGLSMLGYRDRADAGLELRVAVIPAVTVAVDFGGGGLVVETTEASRASGGMVAGFAGGLTGIRAERAACVEVRMSPLRAYSVLGVGPGELGAAVGLDEVWGAAAERLRGRLAEAVEWEERFVLMRAFLAQRFRPDRTPDPEVVAGWNHIVTSRGHVRIADVAESCGWSRKRLWTRFESQIGLTPKRAAMLVRFRHAVEGLVAGRRAADVAVSCGYSDQAHMSREIASFAGRTPGALARETHTPIGQHRYRAWGTFFQDPAGVAGRE